MSKLLSIVIPVYKVEKYIRQCLDSVIVSLELMDKLEVIVINDGTPDNSGTIAHDYAKRFPDMIQVIDKENGGHGSAWNLGLKLATGKYIRFLDSDDWLTDLSDFLILLESTDSDLVFTHLNRYYEDTQKTVTSTIKGIEYGKEYSTSSFSYIDSGNDYYMYDFWYCTYRTEILHREQPLFLEKVSYDDAILFLAPYVLGESMVFLDLGLYNYRLGRSDQSVNKKVELKKANDYARVSLALIDFANRHQNINENKKRQRDDMLYRYMKNRCSLFSCLPYKEYRDIMKFWFPYVKKQPYIKLSPKLKIYDLLPAFVSWPMFQLMNMFIIDK